MKSGLKSLVVLLLLVTSAWAQMMPHAEYQNFLKKLDADTARWQKQLNAFHVEDLPVSYVEGKFVKASQDDASKNFDSIHEVIGQELVRPRLSVEIEIAGHLESAFLELTSLNGWAFRLAPQASERWREEAAGNTGELMLYRVSMVKHVTAYADELQRKAEKCSP